MATAVPAQATVGGALKFVNCYEGHSGAVGAGCTQVNGLTGIAQMAIDDQGRNVYAAARTTDATGNALAVFDRDPVTGALTQKPGDKGCFSAPGNSEGCTALGTSLADNPLRNVLDVVVTHDGAHVYTVGSSGGVLATFSRDTATGELTYQGCLASKANTTVTTCTKTFNGLNDPVALAVDSTDTNVYVVNAATSRIGAFLRNKNVQALGGLSQPSAPDPSPWCISQDGTDDSSAAGHCIASPIVSRPNDVAVTPDGKQLIVSSEGGVGPGPPPSNVSALNRDAPTGGTLSVPAGPFAAGQGRCVSLNGAGDAAGGCLTLSRLSRPDQFALNADGSRMYVAARSAAALLTIDRDTAANAFTLHSGKSACVFNGAAVSDCSNGDAMQQPFDVVVADGGKSVYMSALSNHSITAYDVLADGGVAQKLPPFGCIFGGTFSTCSKLITDSPVEGMLASPDGRSVYAALNSGGSDDRILAFAVDRPPTCNPLSASTAFNTTVNLQLACPDPDNDANTFAIDAPPAKGTLAAVQPGGTVNYGPLIGTSGADSFTFHAVTPIVTAPGAAATALASDPATFTVNVDGPQTAPVPAPPAQQPPPPATPKIKSTVAAKFAVGKRFTKVLKLLVSHVPGGAAVKLTCKGGKKRGCPFKSKAVPVAGGKANAGALLKRAKLRPGAVLQLSITKRGFVGRVFRYTIRSAKQPLRRTT